MRRVVVVALGVVALLVGGCDGADGPTPSGDDSQAAETVGEGSDGPEAGAAWEAEGEPGDDGASEPVDEAPVDEPEGETPVDEEPVDEPVDEEPEVQAKCQELVGEVLNPADFKGFCDHGDVHITDAGEWATFVDKCMSYNQDTLPEIDFATQAVVGSIVELACPFSDGYHVDPPMLCDGTVEFRAAIDRDYCYCDYFFDAVHLVVVEAAGVDGVAYDEREEPGCEERQCQCGDEVKDACEVYEGWGACSNIW